MKAKIVNIQKFSLHDGPGIRTLVFFKGKQINFMERLVLSLGLSIAIVTLSIFALNVLFDVSISGFNSVLIISSVIVIPLIIYGLSKLTGGHGAAK